MSCVVDDETCEGYTHVVLHSCKYLFYFPSLSSPLSFSLSLSSNKGRKFYLKGQQNGNETVQNKCTEGIVPEDQNQKQVSVFLHFDSQDSLHELFLTIKIYSALHLFHVKQEEAARRDLEASRV